MIQLNEMAMARKDFLDLLRSLHRPFMEHIYLVASFKNSTGDLNHWLTELATWCTKLDNITLKNGNRPKAEDFLSEFLTKVETATDADAFLGTAVHNSMSANPSMEECKKFVKNWKNLRNALANSFSSSKTNSRSYYQDLIKQYLL